MREVCTESNVHTVGQIFHCFKIDAFFFLARKALKSQLAKFSSKNEYGRNKAQYEGDCAHIFTDVW